MFLDFIDAEHCYIFLKTEKPKWSSVGCFSHVCNQYYILWWPRTCDVWLSEWSGSVYDYVVVFKYFFPRNDLNDKKTTIKSKYCANSFSLYCTGLMMVVVKVSGEERGIEFFAILCLTLLNWADKKVLICGDLSGYVGAETNGCETNGYQTNGC